MAWEFDRALPDRMARLRAGRSSGGQGPQRFARLTRHPDLLVLPGLLLLTALLRLVAYASAYDVYADEYFYQQMGASVAAGHVPPVDGRELFVLHPPGLFILEALWQRLSAPPAVRHEQVMAMRRLQVVLAVVTALGIYLLLRSIAGRCAAVMALLVFAVDPFVLRQNGRVLLETATVAFLVLGWVPIVRVVHGRARRPELALVGGGLLLGCATATKDLGVFLATVPLLAVFAFRWGLTRRQSAVAVVASLVPYMLFVAAIVAQGGMAQLWQSKTGGLSRLLGLDVFTGYNLRGAPSLTEVAIAQMAGFVPSYVVMVLGSLAALWLVLRGPDPGHRIIGAIGVCASLLVGYSAVFATSEEQHFYFLIVPALLALAVAVALATASLRRQGTSLGRRRSAIVAGGMSVGVIAAMAGADLGAWVSTRTTPDDGQRRVMAWIRQNVPPGATIAFVAEQTRFQLAGSPWRGVPLDRPEAMTGAGVRYLVVVQKEVEHRYTADSVTAEEVAWFTARGREVFAFTSPSSGRVSVYQTLDPRQW